METAAFQYRRSGTLFLAFAAAMLACVDTYAAAIQFDVIPSLRVEEIYDSNVNDQADGEVSSLGTRISAGGGLRFTAPDNVMLQLSGGYARTWFYDTEARDAKDDTWNLRVNSKGAWKLTPSFSIRPSAYYLRTPDAYRRVEMLPSSDQTLKPVTITNFGTVKTDEFGGGLEFIYKATPKLDVLIKGNYSWQEFPGDNSVGFRLADSTEYGGGGRITFLVSPRATLGMDGSVNRQEYERSRTTNTYFAGVQFGYVFSPVLSFNSSAGASMVREETNGLTAARKETSPAGRFVLAYRNPDSVGSIFGSILYSGGSGFGETTRLWTIGLDYTRNITLEWAWNITGAYQKEKSAFDGGSVDMDKVYGRSGVSYNPWKYISFHGYISMNHQVSDGNSGSSIDTFAAVLGFTFGRPLNIF